MNKIDNDFKNLINDLSNSSEEEIFQHIKDKFLNTPVDIIESIEKFLNTFKYWGDLDYKNENFEELKNRTNALKNHLNDFIWLYTNLKDYRSKQILYSILNYWYNMDFNPLDKSFEKNYTQYFDLDLIKCDDQEVFVDVGAFTGDTIKSYIDNYGAYKKIYAYDITPDNIKLMKNNLKEYENIIYNEKAVSNCCKAFYLESNNQSSSANKIGEQGDIKVYSTTLDDDIEEKITLIKMDIEGSEENALLGAINHIKNDTPKLLISVYHNHQDIWKLPLLIYSINSNYNFYLRYFGNKYYPTEIVLIAIPQNC